MWRTCATFSRGEEVGFNLTPPYLAPTTSGPVVLQGVNYASGGGGILNESGQIFRLYSLGARKVIVVNVGPIGCIPYQRAINPSAGDNCVNFPNVLAQLYNTQLRGLVSELSSKLTGSKFVYADAYGIVQDIIQNYSSYGFENANSACCSGGGRFGEIIPCGPSSKICANRSKYVFCDPYHPTEAANIIIAKRLLDGNSPDIWPMNVRQLFASS